MNTARPFSLSGNALKILAALFMLIDHAGMLLFPHIRLLRIIGRLAMPIFAFMIAEGCKYTKNKLRYVGTIAALAAVYQLVYYLYNRSTYMCILVTFTLSIVMIYAMQFARDAVFSKDAPLVLKLTAPLLFILSVGLVYILNLRFTIDYGFFGCMLPVFASLLHASKDAPAMLKKLDCIPLRVCMLGVGMVLLSTTSSSIQCWSLLSLPLLFMYSGRRGKYKMKYFFYIFYPAHLVLLEGIAWLVG